MFTADCTSPFQSTELVYFLEASCSTDFIYVFGDSEFTLPKRSVGVILVSVDILIVLILLSLLSFQGWNERTVCEEIDQAGMSASRYSVEIRNMPPPQDGGQARDAAKLKSEMWQWIE